MNEDNKTNALSYAEALFKRLPKTAQMRDPMNSQWNRSLIEALSTHELAEMIDFSQMNEIFQNFLDVVGLPVAIIDFDARVLASSNWQRVCMEFHRVNPGTLPRCLESDTSLSRQMLEGKSYAIYRCLNGLTDCASPIVIEDKHIANLFIGQFFMEPPDMEYFGRQQQEFGFPKDEYFKAIAEVPIVSDAKIPAILNLLTGLAHQIAKQSLAEKRSLAAYALAEQDVAVRTRELRDSHLLFKKLSEQVPGVIYQFQILPDGKASFPYASDGIRTIFELSPEQVHHSADPVFNRIHREDIDHITRSIAASSVSLAPWNQEFRVVLPKQGLCWREGNAIPEKLPDGSILWHGFITDITRRMEYKNQLEYLAHYDSLTNLPNRVLLADRLHQGMASCIRHNKVLAVIYLDLDGFKAVNDHYSHDVGDKLLVIIAQRMKEALREGDTLARIGGDEFVAVAIDLAQPKDVEPILQRLLQSAAKDVVLGDTALHVTASIGVTFYPQDMVDADQLMRHADQAMYVAKQTSKNCYRFFSPESNGLKTA